MDIIGLENKSNNEIKELLSNGGKVVYFQYTISMIFLTQKNNSPFFYIAPNESTFSFGVKYLLLSLFFGWWGIPWGPIYTLETLFTTLFGGKEVTKDIQDSIPDEFKMKVFDDRIEGDDFNWDTFKIDIKGIIEGRSDNFDMKFVVQMFDTTNGEYPILSTFEDFQETNSRAFFFESKVETLPYKETVLNDWFNVVSIPKFFLEFPKKGKRKIKIKVFVIDANTRNILAKDTMETTYMAEEKGYLDRAKDIEYFEEMAIKTAMIVSASDGNMDDDEANVVKDWIKRRLSYFNEDRQIEEKSRLNGYIREIYTDIESDDVDIYEVLEGIENIASEGEKFELFQLCLDVAQADGEADEAELKIIHDIAEYIDLDRKQFRSMIEKTLPVTMHTAEANDETLLGIDSSMTDKEVKKHLREQYKKWNSRVASNDAEVRKQAEKMIHLIAEARKKYVE